MWKNFINDKTIKLFINIICFVVLWRLVPSKKSENLFAKLSRSIPNQTKDFWIHLNSLISLARDNNEPVTLIYLYTKKTEPTLQKFLREAPSYILNELEQHLPLNNSELIRYNNHSINELKGNKEEKIAFLRTLVEQRLIFIVDDIDQIRASDAELFHFLCDKYSGDTKKSVFLFTIKLSDNDMQAAGGSLESYASRLLEAKWSNQIAHQNITPLIARITETVLTINS